MNDELRIGDRIRVPTIFGDTEDFTIEKFRGCLGIFTSRDHRQAGDFTPLCHMYERGASSVDDYIPNYGSYITNQVPTWMNIPKSQQKQKED